MGGVGIVALKHQPLTTSVKSLGGSMKTAAIGLTTVLVLASASFGPAKAASDKPLVPGYEAAKDLPGARELPDPKTDYKVIFADNQESKNPDDVNPMLP